MRRADDFPSEVIRVLSERAGTRCSLCDRQTTGPHSVGSKALRSGVAAHICAAQPGGPRYDSRQTANARRSAANGIWVCHSCSDIIDKDVGAHSAEQLRKAKTRHEHRIKTEQRGSPRSTVQSDVRDRERDVVRRLGLRKQLKDELNALRRKNAKPFEAGPFSHLRAIVHSVDDATYPKGDPPGHQGISGWFRVELWDFYFNGLEFIMDVDRGIIDEQGYWCVVDEGTEWDKSRFQEIKMYRLARIPFENIVGVDVDGDEYYPEPHLYCRFANGGAPYESFRHLLINGEETYPLEEELRLATLKRNPDPPKSRKPSRRQ